MASIKGKDEKAIVKRAWVFFAVSAFILELCLILLLISFNRYYFQYYLTKTDKKPEPAGANVTTANSEEDLRNDKSTVAIDQGQDQNNLSKIEKSTQIVPVEQNEANIKKSNEKTQLTFCELFHRLWDLDFIILLVYAVSFALFPYATINQKLFSLTNTIINIYNAFDTIGRYIVELFTPTKRKNIINAFSRCSLIFFIILIFIHKMD